MNGEWKSNLTRYFEEISILQSSIEDTLEKFGQFCEFVAEPAFENLKEELEKFGLKSRFKRVKRRSITFQIFFAGSRIDNLNYIIVLPKNSIEMSLQLIIKGRKTKKSVHHEHEEPFMPGLCSEDVLKLEKDDLIHDIIEHFRIFNFSAITSSE